MSQNLCYCLRGKQAQMKMQMKYHNRIIIVQSIPNFQSINCMHADVLEVEWAKKCGLFQQHALKGYMIMLLLLIYVLIYSVSYLVMIQKVTSYDIYRKGKHVHGNAALQDIHDYKADHYLLQLCKQTPTKSSSSTLIWKKTASTAWSELKHRS